jgi:hypothetical protein
LFKESYRLRKKDYETEEEDRTNQRAVVDEGMDEMINIYASVCI